MLANRHLERLQWLSLMEGLRRRHLKRHSRGGSGIMRWRRVVVNWLLYASTFCASIGGAEKVLEVLTCCCGGLFE